MRLHPICFTLLIWPLLTLAACTAVSPPPSAPVPLPTLLPTAVSLITTTTNITNSTTLSETVTSSTAVLPTAPATTTPTATPVTPALALLRPRAGEALSTGTSFLASGTRTAEAGWRLELVLLGIDGRLLTAVPIPLEQTGSADWQVELSLPSQVSGQAVMQVNLFDNTGRLLAQDSLPVTLLPDPNDQRVLLLFQPQAGDTAVPGYYLYFEGQSKLPAENLIRLALLDATCQTVLREDSFRVSGGGYWQGFLPIPADTPAGPACARAAFGPPNSDNRRETLWPITVLDADDPLANQIVVLGSLPEDGQVRSGETRPLYGLAYNAPNDTLYLSLALPDGTVLLAETLETNQYGYWETTLRIPVGVTGQARLGLFTATAVQTVAERSFILQIRPD